MDWATLTRDDVENDGLPRLCVYCGRPSSGFRNRTFEWSPSWAQWWLLLGVLPGLILVSIYGRRMRVSLPVCEQHRNFGLWLGLVAGLGWLVIPGILGGVTALTCLFLLDWQRQPVVMAAAAAALLGLLIWLAWAIRLAMMQIGVDAITDRGILLRGLAHDFVMAVKTKAAAKMAESPPNWNPADLPLDLVKESPSEAICE